MCRSMTSIQGIQRKNTNFVPLPAEFFPCGSSPDLDGGGDWRRPPLMGASALKERDEISADLNE